MSLLTGRVRTSVREIIRGQRVDEPVVFVGAVAEMVTEWILFEDLEQY